jgi:hypothetical protein
MRSRRRHRVAVGVSHALDDATGYRLRNLLAHTGPPTPFSLLNDRLRRRLKAILGRHPHPQEIKVIGAGDALFRSVAFLSPPSTGSAAIAGRQRRSKAIAQRRPHGRF